MLMSMDLTNNSNNFFIHFDLPLMLMILSSNLNSVNSTENNLDNILFVSWNYNMVKLS